MSGSLKQCLLNNITNEDVKAAHKLPLYQCHVIAACEASYNGSKKINWTNIKFNDPGNPNIPPGETLLKELFHGGYKAEEYKKWLKIAGNAKTVSTYYKPEAKIAVLISNSNYKWLSRLTSPSKDCETLTFFLKRLGFIVITIRDCGSKDVKDVLEKVFEAVPEKSYCFILYAGHGFEINNTRCTLDVTSPYINITIDHCITENFILNTVAKRKPELCVLLMDMCRLSMERDENPAMYESIESVEPFDEESISNLVIGYSTSPNQKAYENCVIEYSGTTTNGDESVVLNTKILDKLKSSKSPYVTALCKQMRLADDLDVSSLIDKVHEDVKRNSLDRQIPMKIQYGDAKRSLYDQAKGDTSFDRLKQYCQITNTRLKDKMGEKEENFIKISFPEVRNFDVIFLDSESKVARVPQKC